MTLFAKTTRAGLRWHGFGRLTHSLKVLCGLVSILIASCHSIADQRALDPHGSDDQKARDSGPLMAAIGDRVFFTNEAVTFQLTAKAAPDQTIGYSCPQCPMGMTVDQESGAVVWTAPAEEISYKDVTFVATTQAGSSSQSIDILVVADFLTICQTNGTAPRQLTLDALKHQFQISDCASLDEKLSQLEELHLAGYGLTDLSPLAGLTGLTMLNLAQNKIDSDLYLSRLDQLKQLDLSYNRLASLNHFGALVHLRRVDLSSNQLMTISSFRSLAQLTTLDLHSNRLRNLASLVGLSSLRTLDISHHSSLDLRHLSQLKSLTIVNAQDVNMANLNWLRGFRDLIELNVSRNRLVELQPMASLSQLRTLDLSQNLLVDIGPIQSLKSLSRLDLQYNNVNDFRPLLNLEQLTAIDLSGNPGLSCQQVPKVPQCRDSQAVDP